VDGLSCEDPFEKETVDERDSLLSFILSKEDMNCEERKREGMELCEKIIPLLLHILSLGEEGRKWLIGFGPMGIVRCGDDEYVVIYSPNLVNELNKRKCKAELGRWKAPEILKEEESKETEQSCVFTLGMTVYTLFSGKKPFCEDNEEVAVGKIITGERPDLSEYEEKMSEFISIIEWCWNEDAGERLNLEELRDKVIDVRCGGEEEGYEKDPSEEDDEPGEGKEPEN
jgi:hypothetical protein